MMKNPESDRLVGKVTKELYEKGFSRKIPADVMARAYEKLQRVLAADSLEDLRSLPSNRLELLQPKELGEWSIRINGQWRIVFKWVGGKATAVRILDYH